MTLDTRNKRTGYWGTSLARQLELEYRCERCHRRMATGVFDYRFLCYACRRALEKKLVKHG